MKGNLWWNQFGTHSAVNTQCSECSSCAQFFSHVWLFVTPKTVACQAPVSMGFSRQECWSGLPFSPPGDLPDPRIKPAFLASSSLAGVLFTAEPPGKNIPRKCIYNTKTWTVFTMAVFNRYPKHLSKSFFEVAQIDIPWINLEFCRRHFVRCSDWESLCLRCIDGRKPLPQIFKTPFNRVF